MFKDSQADFKSRCVQSWGKKKRFDNVPLPNVFNELKQAFTGKPIKIMI